jgi:hypothetical protein
MPAAPAQPRLPQIAHRSPAAAPSRLPMNRSGLPPPNRQQIGAHIMPACHIDDTRRRCLAFLNDPKLLDRRPSSPSLRTRQNRNLAHVCSFACKSISKLSQPRFSTGRRPSPEGYDAGAALDDQIGGLHHRVGVIPAVQYTATPRKAWKEGQPITVLSEAVVVPSGVVRLMELQEKGWSYVRP